VLVGKFRHVLLAYIDETGNTGNPALSGATACFGLGCVLVDVDRWRDAHDQVLDFRRRLRGRFGIRIRWELKANFLIRGGGPLSGLTLSPDQRKLVYRSHLRLIDQLDGVRAFAVLVDKERWKTKEETFDLAWTTMLERLERTSKYEKQPIMIIHDEGENDRVRKAARKARKFLPAGKHWGQGSFTHQAENFVEDPIPRTSHHSYFVQFADLVAYAGWRTYMAPTRSVARVCPESMWQELGSGIHAPVNKISGGEPGVVVRRL